MHEVVEELKKRINIVEFIGSYITLKKAGRNFKAICPFHNEKNPSFVVSPDRQIWHCFGSCHEGGDVIKFMMKWENSTFYEVVKELTHKYGVKLPTGAIDDKAANERERLFSLNAIASEYFTYVLTNTTFGEKALEYLHGRGMSDSIIKTFSLGYAPSSWDSLTKFLKKKKFTEREIIAAGLVVTRERGGFYDRFRGRLMFPLKDLKGLVVGFSGRVLEGEGSGAKYINTPETILYHKRETLFGINLAKEGIKKENNVYIVEGEFDMINPFEHGVTNVVAIKGSALTMDQLMLLRRYTNTVTLALDTDEAGIDAMIKGIELAEDLEFELKIATFDYAKDPDEAVRTDAVRFKKALFQAVPVYDFLFSIYEKRYPTTDPFAKKKFADNLVPVLDRIRNPIIRTHYFRLLAQKLDIEMNSLELIARRLKEKKTRFSRPKAIYSAETKEGDRSKLIEKHLISLLLQDTPGYKLSEELFEIIKPDDFSLASHQKLLLAYLDFQTDQTKRFDINVFIQYLPAELQAVADELYLFASGETDAADLSASHLGREIKRYALKRRVAAFGMADELTEADKKALSEALLELNRVEKNIISV